VLANFVSSRSIAVFDRILKAPRLGTSLDKSPPLRTCSQHGKDQGCQAHCSLTSTHQQASTSPQTISTCSATTGMQYLSRRKTPFKKKNSLNHDAFAYAHLLWCDALARVTSLLLLHPQAPFEGPPSYRRVR
jgi:hypothetical protein